MGKIVKKFTFSFFFLFFFSLLSSTSALFKPVSYTKKEKGFAEEPKKKTDEENNRFGKGAYRTSFLAIAHPL